MTGQEHPWYRWEGDDLLLFLRIQPRGGRDAFVGVHGDRYKVRITAPPVDGRANAQLIRFLAKAFGVGRADVRLVSGESSRNKGVRIEAPVRLPIPVQRTPEVPDQ